MWGISQGRLDFFVFTIRDLFFFISHDCRPLIGATTPCRAPSLGAPVSCRVSVPEAPSGGVVVGRCVRCEKPWDDYGSRSRCTRCAVERFLFFLELLQRCGAAFLYVDFLMGVYIPRVSSS